MKSRKFGFKNVIYLILTIGAIIAFLIVFKIDQFARCKTIHKNDKYIEISERLFVPITMSKEDQELANEYVKQANSRNKDLFLEMIGEPTIIITSEDEEAISFRGNYVGATHHSLAGLYVIIGPDGFNLDVISHELAHSELSAKVGWYKTNKIPIWFNEGVATQVDYRKDYSLERWNIITKNGAVIPEVKALNKPEEFYNSDYELRIDNYTLAKQEVGKWLDLVGKENLNELINKFKNGDDLYQIYTEMLLDSSKEIRK